MSSSLPVQITYLLIPWCRVLLEKLTGLQLVKKFPAFHGTRRFITALTIVRHLSLSWTSPIQSTYPHSTSWRSILILSTNLLLGLPSGLFPSGFPIKTLYTPLSSPIRATCPAHHILPDFITRTILGEEHKNNAVHKSVAKVRTNTAALSYKPTSCSTRFLAAPSYTERHFIVHFYLHIISSMAFFIRILYHRASLFMEPNVCPKYVKRQAHTTHFSNICLLLLLITTTLRIVCVFFF